MSTIKGSVEANKAAALRWNEEGMNGQNVGLFEELFHPSYRQLNGKEGPWSATMQGRDAAKEGFTKGFQDFPTFKVTIDDIFGEGDKVALRVTGYIDGKAAGYANIVYRFEDGKIIDDWNTWTFFNDEK